MCGRLPGLGWLQRPELEELLRAIGIWNPRITRCGRGALEAHGLHLTSFLPCILGPLPFACMWELTRHGPLTACRDCLPVLLSLVVSTLHAVSGQRLRQAGCLLAGAAAACGAQAEAHGPTLNVASESGARHADDQGRPSLPRPRVQPEAPPLYRTARLLGSVATSLGALPLALLVSAWVVWGTPQGLLGAGYVALIAGMLLLPPR